MMGIAGAVGEIAGGIVDILNAPKKPKLPPLKTFTPEEISKLTVDTANANLPGAIAAAGRANVGSARNALDVVRTLFPGAGNVTSLIDQLLTGRLTAGQAGEIDQASAGRSLLGGFAGSPVAELERIQARSSGALKNQLLGTNVLQSWLQGVRSFMPAPVSPMWAIPDFAQTYALAEGQDQKRMGWQWLKNQITAMPDPFLTTLASSMRSAGAALSGMGGGQSPWTKPGGGGTLFKGELGGWPEQDMSTMFA